MLLDIAIIVFLMVAAILLILAEIFLLPGITLAGIGGAIFAIGGVALKTDIDSKLISSRDLGIEPGDEGITLSRLAPIGKARIKGINVEAKSQDELIDENTPIVVIRVDSYNVIVRPKEETNIHA